MSMLKIYDDDGALREVVLEAAAIRDALQGIDVQFERWEADRPVDDSASNEEVIAAYSDSVNALKERHGFKAVDVVSLGPDHPDKDALRAKFLSEHTHGDFEVRFFVGGRGLFYLHADGKVYAVLCEQGDLISVPANTPHWFDMGTAPSFKCIRLFTTPEGWVAEFTGSDIAGRFPDFDQFVQQQA